MFKTQKHKSNKQASSITLSITPPKAAPEETKCVKKSKDHTPLPNMTILETRRNLSEVRSSWKEPGGFSGFNELSNGMRMDVFCYNYVVGNNLKRNK
jgi:hypothetical protein